MRRMKPSSTARAAAGGKETPICKLCACRDNCVSLCERARGLLPGEHRGRGERTYTAGRLHRATPVGAGPAPTLMDIFRRSRGLLTKRQFEIVECYYGLALSQSQIARQLGVRRQTVGRVLMQARRRLIRKCLPPLHRMEEDKQMVTAGRSLKMGHLGDGFPPPRLTEAVSRRTSSCPSLHLSCRPETSRESSSRKGSQ